MKVLIGYSSFYNPIFFSIYRYKDGQEVRADARLIIKKDSTRVETYSLTLNLVKGTDSGDYEIKASNFMGTASSKSRVIVQSEYIPRTPDSIRLAFDVGSPLFIIRQKQLIYNYFSKIFVSTYLL